MVDEDDDAMVNEKAEEVPKIRTWNSKTRK